MVGLLEGLVSLMFLLSCFDLASGSRLACSAAPDAERGEPIAAATPKIVENRLENHYFATKGPIHWMNGAKVR
jgi:hypothetical protein